MVNKYDNYELKKVTSLEKVPDTIKDGDGYIWDPSGLPDKDFDDSKVPLEFRRLAIWMRSKLFGKDVRETIARLAEMFGLNFKELMESFESLDDRQDILETQTAQSVAQMEADKDAVIANATVDSEVILARGGKATLGARLDDTTAQLVQIVDDHSLSPDYFEGTDHEKITRAIERVLSFGGGVIRLPRVYDLTGENPIMLDKLDSNDRRVVTFLGDGGGFKKEDYGYMFSSTVRNSGDWFFNNVLFHSIEGNGTKIFDGVNLIRIQWDNCHARNVDTLVDAPNSFIQTYSFNGGSVIGGKGSAIKIPSAYDLVCGGHFYVEHRENFFEQVKETTSEFRGLYNVRFTDMMVEGLSGFAFKITRAEALKMSGVYFEVNIGGHILMDEADYLDAVKIESCRFHENATTTLESAITWGEYLRGCSTSNNFARNIALHDTSAIHEASIYDVTSYQDVAMDNARNIIPNIDIREKIIKQEDYYRLTAKDGVYTTSLRGYTSSTDFNNLTQSGVYHMASSAPNTPYAGWSICEVFNMGNFILQKATARPSGTIYTRFRESGTWTEWRRNPSETIL